MAGSSREKKNQKNASPKSNLPVVFSIVVSSFVSLLFCSKCSFLYPFNDWYDANILFTMGKGLMQGQTLYVDLIDHKGPYIYLLYGIAYLISHKSFLGLFVLEFISLTSFLFIVKGIVSLYSDKKYPFIYPLISVAIVSSSAFVHGGSAEEFSFPLLAYAIYLSFKLIKKKDLHPAEVLLAGVFSGLLFWSKFTLCGCFLAWILVVFIVYILEKKPLKILNSALIYAAGCIISSTPWFVYFGIKKSIPDFFNTYLFANTFEYTNEAGMSFVSRITSICSVAKTFYLKKGNLFLTLLLALGIIGFLIYFSKKISLTEKLACILLFAITNLGVFFSGEAHGYYGLVSAVFLSVFAVSLTVILDERLKKDSFIQSVYMAAITFVFGIVLIFFISDNVYMLKVKKEEMPQFSFVDIINNYEDKSLLNYGFLDGGFYTVLGTMPDVKEYCALNLHYTEFVLKQREYLAEGRTNFVVTWYEFPIEADEVYGKFPEVEENYDIVKSQTYFIEGGLRTYTLWKRSY